jgi:hypothetical protein
VRRTRQIAAALSLAVVALSAVACSASSNSSTASSGDSITWTTARLPKGFDPSLITPAPNDSLLVSADGSPDGRRPPRLIAFHQGFFVPLTVVPTTYYGSRAAWRALATRGEEVFALGGRSGGAHGNTRWTAWSGARGSVREQPQLFETFGGPDAGGLAAVVVPDAGPPVIVGSRVAPDHSGLDIALWDDVGSRWVRRSSAGTALAASADQQPTVGGATRRRDGMLITGAITQVVGGRPRLVPAVWTAPTFAGPWTRTELPTPAPGVAEAQSATCDPDGSCLVVGYAEDHLALWRLSPSGEPSPVSVPKVAAGPDQTVLAPVGADGRHAIAVSAAEEGRSTVLLENAQGWRVVAGPPGAVTGFAEQDGTLWIVAATGSTTALWSSDGGR